LLRLLFRADKENFSTFADGVGKKVTGRLQLIKGLAEVDDVDAVTRVKDEWLHLGVPPFGLVSEMDAGIQQFFNTNTNHNFPLVRSPWLLSFSTSGAAFASAETDHPAEHGIDFSVVVAANSNRSRTFKGRSPLFVSRKGSEKISDNDWMANLYLPEIRSGLA